MFGNPQRYKAVLQQYEARHANAGCLLALLFVVPFLARSYSVASVSCGALVYVTIVVPLATGYITAGTLMALFKRCVMAVIVGENSLIHSAARHSRYFLHWLHSVYLHLENIHTTTNQVVFNMAAEKVLCPDERFASLYVLLFYTVLAYLQQSLKKRQWSQVLHETTAADFLRLTTAFVVARLGKAIVMGMVLLTFTVQFNDIEPPISYVLLTAAFFLLSQFPGTPGEDSPVVTTVRSFDLYELEGLEEWWMPTITRSTTITMSAMLVMFLLLRSHWILALLLGYTNVMVPWSLMMEQCWSPLCDQRQTTAQYSMPSLRQVRGQVCPVCLDDMRLLSARVTPCRHVLHTYCLRKCVQSFHQCPLCKHPL
ncbi:uncharacterized protein LOC129003149 [Macrosteles quadrilineatus]|uniref:uncharacterized protein LOC129003149 n=1 Tax=Macrosteles quadrilineatus TaxID=74068 RepID=UPI0023E1EAEF|nr:uncharacterized protein LOC129003149 [Macrosteles quadrilineatus]